MVFVPWAVWASHNGRIGRGSSSLQQVALQSACSSCLDVPNPSWLALPSQLCSFLLPPNVTAWHCCRWLPISSGQH